MMDYRYIEQLLERYWECNTSLEEEQILRSFFRQTQVPAKFAQYTPLFAYQQVAHEEHLGDDFDQRVEAIVAAETPTDHRHTKARLVTLRSRFAPFAKAAATVAVILTIGGAAERAVVGDHQDEKTVAPIVADTYVRGDDVASVISPVAPKQRITEGGATAQNTDSVASPIVSAEVATPTE